MNRRVARGQQAETAAMQWLRRNGLKPVERNYHCRYGELDLIMLEDNTLVVVEVRSRTSADYLSPALSIDHRKQGKIFRSTEDFLQKHPRFADTPVRFDVVALTGNTHTDIAWIRDAFEPD